MGSFLIYLGALTGFAILGGLVGYWRGFAAGERAATSVINVDWEQLRNRRGRR